MVRVYIHSFICFFNIATDNTQWTYNKQGKIQGNPKTGPFLQDCRLTPVYDDVEIRSVPIQFILSAYLK